MIRFCEKCRGQFDERDLQKHHLIPKFMGGTDKDGRLWLCKIRCHNILHNIIPKIIFNNISPHLKQRVRNSVKSFTLNWVLDKKENDTKTNIG